MWDFLNGLDNLHEYVIVIYIYIYTPIHTRDTALLYAVLYCILYHTRS